MPIYRRKPHEIAAVQWDGTLAHADLLIAMFGADTLVKEVLDPVEGMPERVLLNLLYEGTRTPIVPGDYLYSWEGRLHVRDPDDFEADYELSGPSAPPPDFYAEVPPSLPLPVAAMEALSAGKRLHREDWNPTERWIKLHQPPAAAEPCLYQKRDGQFKPWSPDESDRRAKWIVIEEKVI